MAEHDIAQPPQRCSRGPHGVFAAHRRAARITRSAPDSDLSKRACGKRANGAQVPSTNTSTESAARNLHGSQTRKKGNLIMLWGLAILFLVLWGLGLLTSYTLGGFVHILLVLAVVVVVIRVIQGRRVT